jgi:Na+/H+ antiporter NhaD/arsenite permease-like protein
MIGAAAGLSFADFIVNQTPCILIILILYCLTIWILFAKELKASPELKARIMKMDERKAITDKKLLYKCLFVITGVIIGFLVGRTFNYDVGVIALAGTSLLLLLHGGKPEDSIREIDWETIIFISGLFIVVKTTEKAGLITILADGLIFITHNNPMLTAIAILWASAFLSAFINNAPYVATMIPLIQALPPSANMNGTLWWALLLGTCLGASGTLVGAPSNMIVAGLSDKTAYPISFMDFSKISAPIMIGTVFVATVYIWLRYFLL